MVDEQQVHTPPEPPRPTNRPRGTAAMMTGGVLTLIGALWLIERLGWLDLSVTTVLALATITIGLSLMVLSRRGAHVGLIVFGAILALITLVTAAAPLEGFQGGIGDRIIEVSSSGDIAADYNLAMGTLTLDLRSITDLDGPTRVSASVGMGELIVRVPADVQIEVQARSGAGEVDILGRQVNGVGLDQSYRSPSFSDGDDSLVLELDVFTGRVEVTDE